jgi:nucleotide-binding universal stress UspA family protein
MISTIAVGTDGSDTAAQAVSTAAEFARRYHARLVLVSAFAGKGEARRDETADEVQWSDNPSARIKEVLARCQDDLSKDGIDCHVLVDDGDPADVIVRLAEECGADLLVIGNRGMQRRVLGSVPNTITHKAPCTVMVVKTT